MVEERRGAQEQVIKINSVKYNIDKTCKTPRCRLYNENAESVTHIISACPNLAKNQYWKRHNKVAKKIRWLLWYEHVPDSLMEDGGCKILWEFPIQTDKVIEHRRPDIVCINKITKNLLNH